MSQGYSSTGDGERQLGQLPAEAMEGVQQCKMEAEAHQEEWRKCPATVLFIVLLLDSSLPSLTPSG